MHGDLGAWRDGRRANVTTGERLLTGLTAAGLMAVAIQRPRLRGALAATSGVLALRAATGYCPVYDSLGVEMPGTREALGGNRGRHLKAQITIAKPPAAVYALWRNLDQLSRALPPRIQVDAIGPAVSRWRLTTEDGTVTLADWTAELINDVPDWLLAWRTTPDATVASAGSIRFDAAPAGQGTEVRVHLQFATPLGRIGAGLARLTPHNPELLLGRSLEHIKRYLELGRVPVLAP